MLSEDAVLQQIAKLLPDDGAALDSFGSSVAISGTTAIVGVSWDGNNTSKSGSAYFFDTVTGSTSLSPDGRCERD